MAFLAQHPAVVDFLDLMSIVPDPRLEQIVVRAGSVLDGTTVAAASAAYPGPQIGLAAGDRVSCWAPCPPLMPWGANYN